MKSNKIAEPNWQRQTLADQLADSSEKSESKRLQLAKMVQLSVKAGIRRAREAFSEDKTR